MLKKRLIGVVTVKNNWAVQSFQYSRYLPLGHPEVLVDNLDRWGADEILLQVIDRSFDQLGPNFNLIERVSVMGVSTPLIYAGGIRNVHDAVEVIRCGADRVVVDSLLRENPKAVLQLAERLGTQAIIASVPCTAEEGMIRYYNYQNHTVTKSYVQLEQALRERAISEVLCLDFRADGISGLFTEELVQLLDYTGLPLILFGGLTDMEMNRRLLERPQVAALAIGNFLSYQEHAVQKYRKDIASIHLRAPYFEVTGKHDGV